MSQSRKIEIRGGNYIENLSGTYVQYDSYSSRIDIGKVGIEVRCLLEKLQINAELEGNGNMALADSAVSVIEKDAQLKDKVLKAIREGGLAAFEKAIDHPAGAFIVSAISSWIK